MSREAMAARGPSDAHRAAASPGYRCSPTFAYWGEHGCCLLSRSSSVQAKPMTPPFLHPPQDGYGDPTILATLRAAIAAAKAHQRELDEAAAAEEQRSAAAAEMRLSAATVQRFGLRRLGSQSRLSGSGSSPLRRTSLSGGQSQEPPNAVRRGSCSGAMRPGLLSHRDGPQGNTTVTEAAAASIGRGEELSLRESLGQQQQQQLEDGEGGGASATAAEEAVDLPRRISGTGVAPPAAAAAAAGVVAVPDHRALFQRVFNGKSLYKLTDMEGQ